MFTNILLTIGAHICIMCSVLHLILLKTALRKGDRYGAYRIFFKRIDNRLKSNADAGLGKHGLTFAQSRIIRFLAEHGGQTTQKEIEDYAHVSHPTIVGIVTRMEQSGFLSTCTDPSDKRNKVVRLTDKAKDINLEIRRSIDNGERAMLRSFSEEEVEQLRGYLIRICDNLDIDSSPGCKPESGAKKEKRE